MSAFSPAEVSEMAAELIARGYHPRVVRRRLAEYGIHWEYEWRDAAGRAPQGIRQRLRNLRRQGLGLCSTCHEKPYTLGSAVNVCPDCLASKWAGSAGADVIR